MVRNINHSWKNSSRKNWKNGEENSIDVIVLCSGKLFETLLCCSFSMVDNQEHILIFFQYLYFFWVFTWWRCIVLKFKEKVALDLILDLIDIYHLQTESSVIKTILKGNSSCIWGLNLMNERPEILSLYNALLSFYLSVLFFTFSTLFIYLFIHLFYLFDLYLYSLHLITLIILWYDAIMFSPSPRDRSGNKSMTLVRYPLITFTHCIIIYFV